MHDSDASESRGWLFATDLDGTLLDEETYDFGPALPALEALRRAAATLVLASSKTRGEMEPLAEILGIRGPLIVENGGAVLVPSARGGYAVTPLGDPVPHLAHELRELAVESDAQVRGFSSLSPSELIRLTGLSTEAAHRALDRSYSEPFVLENESVLAQLEVAAGRRGLRLTRGGRFFHLTGATDKGHALRFVLEGFERRGIRFRTVALGDSENDLAMLRSVDRPILMPRPGGSVNPGLAAALPLAERAPAPGPSGWNAAVLTVLSGGRLPQHSPLEPREIP